MTECGCGHGDTPVAREQTRVLISNLAVIAAGALVALTQSQWPDLVVGFAIALLFLRTSFGVIGRSVAGLRQAA